MLKHCPIFPQEVSENRQPDNPAHIVGHYLNRCPKRPKKSAVGHCVGVMLKHCPIFPQGVSENRQPDNPAHIVGHYLNRCPKSPKVGRRTVAGHCVGLYLNRCPECPEIASRTPCRSYAQTLSDFPSRGVRKSATRQSCTHCRTLPQQVSEKSESWQTDSSRTLCRTLPQQVSETSENRLSDTVSELCSSAVRFSLKGCPKSSQKCNYRHPLPLMPERYGRNAKMTKNRRPDKMSQVSSRGRKTTFCCGFSRKNYSGGIYY